MITLVKGFLLTYSLVDFSLQIVAQMPILEDRDFFNVLGIRKIWQKDEASLESYLKNEN